jgi:gliding motility-associated-like protein
MNFLLTKTKLEIMFKKIFFVGFLFLTSLLKAQVNPGASCDQAGCSLGGSYANLTGSASMGAYSCLGSTPNANWLALGIANNGNVHLTLTQVSNAGTPIDVDFALYGPYTSVSAGCPIGPTTPTVDCSYSGSATEYVDIIGAIAGQVYILLVTNFNGGAGTISLSPNNALPSTGSINCNTNFTATTTQIAATCGQATGSATVTAVGGYPPYTYTWNLPGSPTTQTVNNLAPGTYTVTVTSSPNPTNNQSVNPTTGTVTVLNKVATFSATSTQASCIGGANGTATANFAMSGGNAGITATYLWNNGQTTKIATGLLPGTYTCTVTLSNGCVGTATVTVGASSVSYSGTSTLVSCPGGSNGTATVSMNPVIGNLSFLWNDALQQTTQTATGLPAGTHTCTITSDIGCVGTKTVTVGTIPGMVGVFSAINDVTCNSANNGLMAVSVTQGTAPYTYDWLNSTSVNDTASDLYVGYQAVSITDANGCVITISDTLDEPLSLKITALTPPTQICPEASITLSVNGTGGSSAYIFTWTENGSVIGTGNSITVNPLNSNTNYCVKMEEVCGSPFDDSCTVLTFPLEILPALSPDAPERCIPAKFDFTNNSSNPTEIASTYFEFSDGFNVLETGIDTTSNTFEIPDQYSVIMTVTSVFGCIYSDTFVNIVNVRDVPKADFTFSSNPATFFETIIAMQDRSSSDVVTWNWLSPYSSPTYSQLQNPVFNYPIGEVGVYPTTLIVTSSYGCVDTVTYNMNVIQDIIMYAPNSFTPDGDEHNQDWRFAIQGIDVYSFNLMLFNKWGEIIWETNDVNSSWDGTYNGKIVQAGSYFWRASAKDIMNDGKHEFSGTINVLR